MIKTPVVPRPTRPSHSSKRAVTWGARNKSVLAFLLVSALLTLGAKLTETPTTDFSQIAVMP